MKWTKFALGLVGFGVVLVGVLLVWGAVQKSEPENYAVQQARTEATVSQLKNDQAQSQFWAIFWPGVAVVVVLLIIWAVVSEVRHRRRLSEVVTLAKVATLAPDHQGNYPARLLNTGELVMPNPGNIRFNVPNSINYSPHTIYQSEKREDVVRPVTSLLPTPPVVTQPAFELPTAPDWGKILEKGFQPSAKKMLLGYDNNGALYGGIGSLLSTAIAGRPGQGKSNLLRLIFAQVVMIGGDCVIMDPHGSIAGELPAIDGVIIASTAQELHHVGKILISTLESRLEAYRKGTRAFTPMLVLADEFPVIALSSKLANEALGRVVLEARKVEIYALISGQGLPADRFGGSLVRDALSSRYVFKTSPQQGRMAGLDRETVKLLEMLDVGRCVFDGPVEPTILAIPRCEIDDLAEIGLKTGFQEDKFELKNVENVEKIDNEFSPHFSGFEPIAGFQELPIQVQKELIYKLQKKGLGKTEIVTTLWNVKPGGNKAYKDACEIYDELFHTN